MATSPLHPASDSRPPDRILGLGHGLHDLGPGDSSDTGSDTLGAEDALDDAPDAHVARGEDIDADHVERAPRELDEDDEPEEKPGA